jgi:hypothetical protein
MISAQLRLSGSRSAWASSSEKPLIAGERRAQLVAHARQELALGGAGRAQLHVGALQLGRAAQDLGRLLVAALLQPDVLGHVLDAVDDVAQALVLVQDRRVARAPVAHLEAPAFLGRAPDVVLLHGHRVGRAAVAHAFQRRAQVAHAVRRRVVGVVREDVEDPATDDLVALRHRRREVRIAHRDDPELRVQDEVEPGRGLEKQSKVRLLRHRRRKHTGTPMSHWGVRKFTHSASSVGEILCYKSRRRKQ